MSLDELIGRVQEAIGRKEPYIYLPEILESLQQIKAHPDASHDERLHRARGLGRLVLEEYACSESELGTHILDFLKEYRGET